MNVWKVKLDNPDFSVITEDGFIYILAYAMDEVIEILGENNIHETSEIKKVCKITLIPNNKYIHFNLEAYKELMNKIKERDAKAK